MVGLNYFVNTLRMPQIDLYPLSIDCKTCFIPVLKVIAPCWNPLVMRNGPTYLYLSLPENKHSRQFFGHDTYSSCLWMWMNFHRHLGKIYQEHSTHLASILTLQSNPSSVCLLPTSPCALARSVSYKPFHKQVCMDTYRWGSCMQWGRPKEHHLASLTNPCYWHLQFFLESSWSPNWKLWLAR